MSLQTLTYTTEGRIARITGDEFGKNRCFLKVRTLRFQLKIATPRPDFRRGGDPELRVCTGRDHGADVAPVQHGAARLARELLLKIAQRGADLRNAGDPAGSDAGLVAAQSSVNQPGRRECLCQRDRRCRVGKIVAIVEHLPPDCAIQQSGVEVGQMKMPGQATRKRSFPGRGRSIDGDNHAALIKASSAGRK